MSQKHGGTGRSDNRQSQRAEEFGRGCNSCGDHTGCCRAEANARVRE